MGEKIAVEDYMSLEEEIDTMKYSYNLSKEEFEEPIQSTVTIKRRVFDYSSSSSSSNFNDDEFGVAAVGTSPYSTSGLIISKKKQQLDALQAIAEYYDHRGGGFKGKLAGVVGTDHEDRRRRKKTTMSSSRVFVDTSNLNILADACCSVLAAVVKQPAKVIPPAAAAAAETSSRKIVKVVKKSGKQQTKRGSGDDVAIVDVLPTEYIEKIQKLNGRDVKLIEQKPLTASDVNPNLCRLLLSQNNSVRNVKFLRDDEEKRIGDKDKYIRAKLMEPMGCYQEIRLTKWNMNHNSYHTLLKPWKEVAATNGFRVNDVVQVWSFRFDDDDDEDEEVAADKLGLAVVRIYTAPRETTRTNATNGSSL